VPFPTITLRPRGGVWARVRRRGHDASAILQPALTLEQEAGP
jgi:hypothetical protein